MAWPFQMCYRFSSHNSWSERRFSALQQRILGIRRRQTEKEIVFLKQQPKFPFVISERRIYLFYFTYRGPSFHQSDSRIATAYKNKLPKQQKQLIKISQVKNQSSGNSGSQNHLTVDSICRYTNIARYSSYSFPSCINRTLVFLLWLLLSFI